MAHELCRSAVSLEASSRHLRSRQTASRLLRRLHSGCIASLPPALAFAIAPIICKKRAVMLQVMEELPVFPHTGFNAQKV